MSKPAGSYSRFLRTGLINKPVCVTFCNKITSSEDTRDDNVFIPVYHFPYIRIFGMLNKTKKYQTILAGAGIPTSIILNQLGLVDMEAVQLTAALGISSCLVLYTAGLMTSKFIGIIYYNESTETAKISYIDFWGSRKDVEIPVNDIVPINELPKTLMDGIYYTFRRFSSKDTFKLSLRYGNILDEGIKKVL